MKMERFDLSGPVFEKITLVGLPTGIQWGGIPAVYRNCRGVQGGNPLASLNFGDSPKIA
jgi:hypothetical protein